MGLGAGPAEGGGVVEGEGFVHFLALEDHGDAGGGEEDGGAEQGAAAGPDAFGVVGMDGGGDAGAVVVHGGDIVVGFGEDDAVVAGPVAEGAGEGVDVALVVPGGGDLVVEGPAVADVPLAGVVDGVVEGVVFGDAEEVGAGVGEELVDVAEESGAVGVGAGVGMEDVVDGVPAVAVDVVFVGEEEDLVADELADFGAGVVGAGGAPGGVGAVVVVEVDAAEVALVPAVEGPEVEVGGAVVVVDNVNEDGDAEAVGGADEAFEGVGSAVVGFDGEGVAGVVAPAEAAGEFVDGHELDAVDAEFLEAGEEGDGVVEGGGGLDASEGADVELVEDEFVVGEVEGAVALPVEGGGVVDDGVAAGVVDLAGAGVAFPEGAVDDIFVALADAGGGVDDGPGAVGGVSLHGGSAPVVEFAGEFDGFGVGRPDAEVDAGGVFPGAEGVGGGGVGGGGGCVRRRGAEVGEGGEKKGEEEEGE